MTNETMTYGGYSDTITLDQQYDAGGNRTQGLWSFGTTEQFTSDYTYDALNRLTELTRSSDEQADYWHRAQFSYNKLGQFLGISRFVGDDTTPIGVADTDFTYDDLNRLLSIEHFTGGTTWAGYDYTYDDASRITSINSYLDGLSEYEHDDTNQLTAADHTGSTDETYTYDANGNRTMSGYTTGDNNQLTSDGVYNYAYDAEGNRLTRTNISSGYVTEYTWDHRNRLTKVTEKDDMDNVLSTVEHWYDAFNRWIRRSADADGPGGSDPVETIFAHDGNQVSLEFTDNDGVDLDGDDLSHVYTWGPTVDQLLVDFTDGDVPQWALTDHLGTVRDFVEYDAGMTDTVDTGHRIFDSFGNITSQSGISSMIGFTGRPFDETTGLQNNLHRWYDPTVGRWVSEDPIGVGGQDTNFSRYVGNAPLSTVDPQGLKGIIIYVDPANVPANFNAVAIARRLQEIFRNAGINISISVVISTYKGDKNTDNRPDHQGVEYDLQSLGERTGWSNCHPYMLGGSFGDYFTLPFKRRTEFYNHFVEFSHPQNAFWGASTAALTNVTQVNNDAIGQMAAPGGIGNWDIFYANMLMHEVLYLGYLDYFDDPAAAVTPGSIESNRPDGNKLVVLPQYFIDKMNRYFVKEPCARHWSRTSWFHPPTTMRW